MKLNLIGFLKKIITFGITENTQTDLGQRIMVTNAFSLIGFLITFVSSFIAYAHGDIPVLIPMFLGSLLFCTSYFVKDKQNKIPEAIILHSCIVLVLILIYTGGNQNTGPLWMYTVPPIIFYFSKGRVARLLLMSFITIVFCMFFLPYDFLLSTYYDPTLKSRLFVSFLTVTVLFGFYEHVRQQSIERIQTLSDKYETQAMRDSLTKLPNRRGMRQFIVHEYHRFTRTQKPMSFLLCDIDHFKAINDQYGHDVGDFILIEISNLLKNSIRKQDKLARWGGEEFLFLLPETTLYDAFLISEKLRKIISSHNFIYQEHTVKVTISIGIDEVELNGNVEHSINMADKALYQAKENGRNKSWPNVNK